MKTQSIVYTVTRVYADRGLRQSGQAETVDDGFARQVIAQGFARLATPKAVASNSEE